MSTLALHKLKPAKGSVKKNKRIGRGQGSGKGGTSTKGHKGDQSRSGYRFKAYFEGGQMPISRRIPKFGFKNFNSVVYETVNISTLERLSTLHGIKEFSPEILKSYGVIHSLTKPLKVLGEGKLSHSIQVKAHKFSANAQKAIEANNGSVIIIKSDENS